MFKHAFIQNGETDSCLFFDEVAAAKAYDKVLISATLSPLTSPLYLFSDVTK